MQPPPADLASFAEDPFSYLPHLPSTAVFERDEYLLVSARDVRPDTASAQRIRLDGPAVEPAISFIRSWFGERGRDELTWWIGSSTTPDDFAERLQDAGARPFEDDPQLTAWCSRRHRRRRRRSRSGASSCVFAEHGALLSGGATLPAARGRGAYRALVRARWDEAVRRGRPVLVVQAGPMSRPILERLGFETVAEIQIFVDRS